MKKIQLSFFDYIGQSWAPGINDPTLMAWLIVLAYLVTAILSFQVAKRGSLIFYEGVQCQVLLWAGISFSLFFLGINKQLDLQSLLASIAKHLARQQGWYWEYWLIAQRIIFSIIFLLVLVTLFKLFNIYKNYLKRNILAVCGLVVLACFILIRVAAFTKVGTPFNQKYEMIGLNNVIELSGILMILSNALLLIRKMPKAIDE